MIGTQTPPPIPQSGGRTVSKLANVDVERINPSPYNPRHEAVDIDDLAASIMSVGIIEPLVVAVDKTDKDHVTLVCGNRRFAAAKKAGLKTVPCVVLPDIGERGERIVSLVENLHRRDMTHIEQGEAFRNLMNTGMTQRQVASAVGVSDFTVSIKVTLVTTLIPEFQELVHRDRMTVTEARELCKLPAKEQRRIHNSGRGNQPRKSAVQAHRRTKTELCLMRALQNYREGYTNIALAEAEKAVGFLRNAAKGIVEELEGAVA